jgi:DNA-binding XRE family transcriptional regulator
MRIDILRRVQNEIRREPRAFDMEAFVTFDGEHEKICGQPCGTTLCIAGWIAALGGASPTTLDRLEDEAELENRDSPTATIARALADLTQAQANELFYLNNWQTEISERFDASASSMERAEIACERIDAFIAQHDPSPSKLHALVGVNRRD